MSRLLSLLALLSLLSLLSLPVGVRAQASDVDTRVPRAVRNRPDAIAVIIGNAAYDNRDVPPVQFAQRDAQAVRQYAILSLGIEPDNVIFVTNATKSKFDQVFGTKDAPGQLSDLIRPGKTDLFVFYSGHGAPDTKSNQAYFVPSDADPRYLRLSGVRVDDLYEQIGRLSARSVFIAIDACFSGFTDGGALVRDASPALLRVEAPAARIKNAVILTASAANEIASWKSDAGHGLFTYFLLKGLQGDGAAGKVTARALFASVASAVEKAARVERSRKQTVQFIASDSGTVLAELSGEFERVAPLPALAIPAGPAGPSAGSGTDPSREARPPGIAPPPVVRPFAIGGVEKRVFHDISVAMRGCIRWKTSVICDLVNTSIDAAFNTTGLQAFAVDPDGGDRASAACISLGGDGHACDDLEIRRRDLSFRQGVEKFVIRFDDVSTEWTRIAVTFAVTAGRIIPSTERVTFAAVPIQQPK